MTVLTGRGKFDEAESILNQALTPGVLQNPGCVEAVRVRGDFIFGHQGRWAEALADYQRALEFRPTEAQNYHGVAPLLVATTNVEAYRQLCPRIVEHFRDTADAGTADQMAKDCLILPLSGAELRAVAVMADLAVNTGKAMAAYPFFQCCKALAEYRQGHWSESVYWATNAAQNPFPYSRGEAWLILAMSEYRLGRTNDARADVAQCELLVEKQLPQLGHDLGGDWRDWIVVHALLKEAQGLIEGRGVPDNGSSSK